MKKFAYILFLLFAIPVSAQNVVWLPIIMKNSTNNSWSIVHPVGSTNYILNPSAETTSNFSAVAGATATRSTTYQKYGLYSYRVQTTGNGDGISLTLSALTDTDHFATARIRNPNTGLSFTIGSATKTPSLIQQIDDNWSLYGIAFSASEVNGQTALEIAQSGTGVRDFNIDGVQVEPLGYWTTYIDGTQEGCSWNGTEHTSTSTRSSQSRAGGEVRDFFEDYGFIVENIIGAGDTTQQISIDSYATLPGGELNNVKIEPREFTIVGKFLADTEEELHAKRQALIEELSIDSFPANQPVKIRFAGAKVWKEIAIHYRSGLEGDLPAFYDNFTRDEETWTKLQRFRERAAIQVTAPNPFWLEVGESAIELDTNDNATFRAVAGRLKSTGQWDVLGPPSSIGGTGDVYAVAEDDTYVYFGGDFINFDGIADADYIVRWHKVNQSYSALGTGMDNIVYDIIIAADGTLFATGAFATAGGGAAARIASWDGSSWSALGSGLNNDGRALAIGLDGLLFVGGAFTTAGGGAANRIASWDGSSWSALSTGMTNIVLALTIGLDGILYAGGNFTSPATRIASWDGSSWSALSTGMNSFVYALAINPVTGVLYAGGDFTTAGSATANQIAFWNGTAWSALGSGANNDVRGLKFDNTGILYATGFFTIIGGIDEADRIAKWNGSTWAHLDVNLPSSPIVYDAVISQFVDPVVDQKYDIYICFTTTGTGNYGGLVAADNEGTVGAFPKVIFERSGGTSAVIETLKNERTGRELLFDYSLLDGEILTIDLTPTQKSIASSMFGSRLDAVLANSDFGSWQLLPSNNDVTSFVDVAGGPTITAYMLWRDAYKSWD